MAAKYDNATEVKVMELKRTSQSWDGAELPDYPADVQEQLEIDIRYEGYLARQQADRQRFLKMEDTPLPPDADYLNMAGLRIEARQKLDAQRPASLGQASRIPGINPGDVTVLMIWLRARG